MEGEQDEGREEQGLREEQRAEGGERHVERVDPGSGDPGAASGEHGRREREVSSGPDREQGLDETDGGVRPITRDVVQQADEPG